MEVSSILITLESSQQNLYDIYLLLCVQYYTPDDGQRNCPKHVEFYSKNKFEKLVHLVGFNIRMECEVDHSPSSSAELQISGVIPPLPYAFMNGTVVNK